MTGIPGANSRAVLVACMPKSGSTFLSAALSAMPGFRREHVVPSYARREQELSEPEIQRAFAATQVLRRAFDQGQMASPHRPRAWVAQNHVKHNAETQALIDRYQIVPVCLVRNIFDIVVSLRDHVVNDSPLTAAAYIDESMVSWEPERMYEFLVDLAVPWYIHFYVSWVKAEHKVLVTYEDLIADPHGQLRRILKFGQLPWNNDAIAEALETVAGGVNVRKNVGTTGRGDAIPVELRARVERFCQYYPDVDFGPIGIG
ncbi:sulfotransferase [Nocardioides antri]|uniref:Sulfotransferase n=1 Tax=Nocardioides antri TaxID=2607659 RepID=A0A5B1M4B9_9ACTN|nr:sulfotransferase [Nocardioides antri]KAA1427278.1 sulfotransferase [Nocardioides antri]